MSDILKIISAILTGALAIGAAAAAGAGGTWLVVMGINWMRGGA